MVDSQSCLGSLQARALGASGEEEEEVAVPELVSTCWGCPEVNSDPQYNIGTPRKSPSMGLANCLQWRRPSDISITPLNFASLSSPSSLANSCTFLIGVWRIIRNLARSTLATVPGRRRRVLFLVQLKNRRILSLRSLCLSCNTHDSGGIFFVQGKWKIWNFCRVPRLVDVEDSPLRVPYIEGEIWGSSPHTKLKEGTSSKISFVQFPREPSTSKSTPLHKDAIEYRFRIPKRSALSPKRKHWWQCTSYAEAPGACHG